MNKNLMWAYLIHLSEHMWDDEFSPARGSYLSKMYTPNNNTDFKVWDEVIKYLAECKYTTVLVDVGDAIKYESHPEISAPNAWDKDFIKKKLDEIRALGMTPIPKLNFSTGHDAWLKKYARMVSTPEYYQVCEDTISEVCELFDSPELFHIGFDEERPYFLRNREMVITRGDALWWHDLNLIAKLCEKNGARPWVWSDYCWAKMDKFTQNMSREVLQSNWFYGTFKDYTPEQIKTMPEQYLAIAAYEELDKHGFEQVPTSSTWENEHNTRQTVAFGKDKLTKNLRGFMTAPWVFTTELSKYRLLDDATKLYFARIEHYPETL